MIIATDTKFSAAGLAILDLAFRSIRALLLVYVDMLRSMDYIFTKGIATLASIMLASIGTSGTAALGTSPLPCAFMFDSMESTIHPGAPFQGTFYLIAVSGIVRTIRLLPFTGMIIAMY